MNVFLDILSLNFMINIILINMPIQKVLSVQDEEMIKTVKLKGVCMIWEFHRIEEGFPAGNLQNDH